MSLVSREEFFDSDDTNKWTEEAESQLKNYPLDGKPLQYANTFFAQFLKDNPRIVSVVDIGCGTGLARLLFAESQYSGIDQNERMLEIAKARWPNDSFYFSPINKITELFPRLIGRFHIGLFLTVLQHNHHEVVKEALFQAHKLIQPGGHLFLVEATDNYKNYPPATRIKYNIPPFDPHRLESINGGGIFTAVGWHRLLKECGFVVIRYDGDCSYIAKRF